MAAVFIIIMCACIIAVVCIDAINECFNSIIGFFFGIAFICAMAFLYDELNPTPKAIDVYKCKTTLGITYRDSVAVDSVVVWKEEIK